MRVEAAGSDDVAFSRDYLGSRSDNDVYVRLHIGISGFPDGGNTPVLDGNVALHNSPVIKNEGVGDDRIDGALSAGMLRLTHAVADALPASELALLAIGREVLLHLDNEVGIRKAHLVPDRWTKHLPIGGTAHSAGHAGYLTGTEEKSWRCHLRQSAHDGLVEPINQARAP